MATQVLAQPGLFGMAPGGGGDVAYELHELSKAELAAPQLVLLANVALTGDAGGGPGDEAAGEERQMAELTTVRDGGFSDSDGDEAPGEAAGPPALPPAADAGPPGAGLEAPGTPESAEERGRGGKSKPFRCKPCQYEAECEEQFVHHIRVHSAKKFFVEESAEKQAQAKEAEAAAGAAEEVDFSKGPIRCDRCGYNTNRYDHYLAHLKHHNKAGENERVYKCTICTYTTVSEYHWKKHLRNHFPRKVYTCSQCSYFSDRKNNYIQHIRTHTGERPYQCAVCPYSSSQKTHLTRHMRTHSGEKPFKCDQCSYVASNQHEVTRHARQVHNGPKPLTCPHCDYKTADRSNFKKHVELHVNPRQFLCPVCDYAASKKCNLQYHIKSRHPDCSDITMDVSKVKLRTKKSEADFSESLSDKAEKEQAKGDSAAKKTEKTVKVEKKENLAKEKKPTSSVCVGQVTTRSRKSASENKEVDIKTERSTEKPCKAKKSKRKAEAEAASSKDEPANDTPAVMKKKKKVETKPRDCQEAPKSDVVAEEEPRKQNSCPKKNRKKKALKSKHGKKSSKPDAEALEEEQSRMEGPAASAEDARGEPDGPQGSSRELEQELELEQERERELEQEQELEQEPAVAAPGGTSSPAALVQSGDAGGGRERDPAQLRLAPCEPDTAAEEEGDQEAPAAAGEGKDTVGGGEEEREAGEGRGTRAEEVSGAASPAQGPDSPMDAEGTEREAARAVGPAGDAGAVDAVAAAQPPAPGSPCAGRTATSDSQEVDEDEGIHSHEGSDISDNISEGSDDSGLNGARSAPEDAGAKTGAGGAGESFVCIFCDRCFGKEGEYSKHLNRHLVNVYYLEKATKGQE